MPQVFSRPVRLLAAIAGFAVLAACGGGGGSVGGGGGGGSPVTVSGRISFDRLQFQTQANGGLDAANPVESPAREVVVEAVAGSSVVATTTTDSNGDYSFSVPGNTTVFIRARAQMLKTGAAPTWNFTVRNNTNSDAVYALVGDSFNTGASDQTRNLRAPSGWGGSSYTGTRAAAPFAILDTVYDAKQLILGAVSTAVFPDLNLYWSIDNRTVTSSFCPDNGDIGTSFYFSGTGADDCSTAAVPEGIYILGAFANSAGGDTDEFDAHVIAHEFGHYFEDKFGRSDSFGGDHGLGDRLDLRLAFGEGWGNAFSGMTQNDPAYRDSFGGISQDFGFDLEADAGTNQGWFSEASIGEFFWDLFDDDSAGPEPGDNVALGFNPIFAAMTGAHANTDAFTSVFSFATALRSANASSAAAITTLLNGEQISGTNAFGAGESNSGGDPTVLPIYDEIFLSTPKNSVCSRSVAGSTDGNKLGNRRFLRFDNSQSRIVTITLTGAVGPQGSVAATDPDILVFRRGVVVAAGESADAGVETLSQIQLEAGTHILDVYDFEVSGTNQPPRCMTVSISGN